MTGANDASDAVSNLLNNLAGQFANSAFGSLFKDWGVFDSVGELLSFDGGGDTPSGPRVGGVDGKGGFLAVLHPDETVIDKTKPQKRDPRPARGPRDGSRVDMAEVVPEPARPDPGPRETPAAQLARVLPFAQRSEPPLEVSERTAQIAPLMSFDGGGRTPRGHRVGGVDGKGGFLAVLHPDETVIDETKGILPARSNPGGYGSPAAVAPAAAASKQPPAEVSINIEVNGARGNSEVREMMEAGVRQGLQEYDRAVLPRSVAKIKSDPRRIS